MDELSEKHTQQRFNVENYNITPPTKFVVKDDYNGEYSGRPESIHNQDFAYDSVDDIIKRYKNGGRKINSFQCNNLDRNICKHELINQNIRIAQSVQSFPTKKVDRKYLTISSKTESQASVTNNDVIKQNIASKRIFRERNYCTPKDNNCSVETNLTSREKLYADKTTYCRPVLNLHNEQFLYKTMERNSRLKRLVKNLAIVRHSEKENVSWNNFINELKDKHGLSCDSLYRRQVSPYESEQYITSNIINDNYNTRFSWQQSRLCRNLLKDFYLEYEVSEPTCTNRVSRETNILQSFNNRNSLPYPTDSYCYPTSSQNRFVMSESEKQKNHYLRQGRNRFSNSNCKYYENNYINNTKLERNVPEKRSNNSYLLNFTNNKIVRSTSIQTERTTVPELREHERKNKATCAEILSKDEVIQTFGDNYENIMEKNPDIVSNTTNFPLIKVEKKVETLIDSINNFLSEIKLQRKLTRKIKCASGTGKLNNDSDKKIIGFKSSTVDPGCMPSMDKLHRGVKNDSSVCTMTASNCCLYTMQKPTKIDEILRDIDKFNSKEVLFKNQPCSVHIPFEVPTKDCSTEVTKSLSKQHFGEKVEIIEEIHAPNNTPLHQMTIAVNTDPLSFLSLLRISTETLKHLLSYVPNMNYYSYLSLIHLPTITRNVDIHYLCNNCGIAFNKPSKLSDHIHDRNLGKTSNCCVCRHLLDNCRRNPGLFRCQFCGQRFTRAYCCELHQQSCARRSGQRHDIGSSVMLLR